MRIDWEPRMGLKFFYWNHKASHTKLLAHAVMDIMVEMNTDLTNIYDYTGV